MTVSLPRGFSVRPITLDDAIPVAELSSAQSLWLNGVEETLTERAEEFRGDWGFAFFNRDTDTRAVFTEDGRLVGYSDFFDVRDPHVTLYGSVYVHPDYFGRGIGTYLAEWLEQRGRDNVSKAPAGARVELQQTPQSNHREAVDLLAARGYQHIRSHYRMRVDFDQPPAPPALPVGITIRAIEGKEDERLALRARHESFLDHWGVAQETFESYYERFQDILANDPYNDPTLWFLAMDGDEPAGVSICYSFTEDDPQMGWVQSLGVRRPWRKRGLGLALLQHSFYQFHLRGCLRAGLGVDASSLTGALRLYERAGMRVERTYHSYALELRGGETLTRQELD